MNILLTGATGFLGSHLLKALLQHGYKVVVLKRSSSNCGRIEEELSKCVVYDIDRTPFDEIFYHETINVVIHCATEYGSRALSVFNSNLVFPFQLLDAAIEAGCSYFIYTDSFFTKQLPERFYQLKTIYAPEYTLSKYQFREWGKLRAIERKINFIDLQMEHIYGPNDGEKKFITFLIRSMKSGTKELKLTDGIQIRDFIYVADAVSAYLSVLDKLKELTGYCHFEVGSGVPHTVRELAEVIRAELEATTELNFGGIPRRDSEIMFSMAHRAEIERTGFSAKTPLEIGIKQTINDGKEQ